MRPLLFSLAVAAGCAGSLPPPALPQPAPAGWSASWRAQDPDALPRHLQALEDPGPAVRAAAAFTVGQLGVAWAPIAEEKRALAEARLIERLAAERDAEVRDRLLEAIGKLGKKPGARALSAALPSERAALALGVLVKRDPAAAGPEAVAPLSAMLHAAAPAERFAAGYALMRLKSAAAREPLLGALADRVALVRAVAAKGLADVAQPEDAGRLLPLVEDADVRVAAEGARALAKQVIACGLSATCPALDALERSKQWRGPVMDAIAFEPIATWRATALLRARFEDYATATVPDHWTRGHAQCKAALAHDRIAVTALIPGCGLGEVPPARVAALEARAAAEGRGHDPQRRAALLAFTEHPEPQVRAIAAEGLGALSQPGEPVEDRLIALVGDRAPSVVAAAAEALEKLKIARATPQLHAQLARWHGPDAIEALQALLSALGTLGARFAAPDIRTLTEGTPAAVAMAAAKALDTLGEPRGVARPAPPANIAYAAQPVPKAPLVVIETSRGTIRVRLFPDEAPATVESFMHLVAKRFYDGLTFHRVVPGFVSQGGDPKGDGSGGPGYNVPCEIGQRRYVEGTMGMALSGRDTGGSQFFFTHTPQPHLDGRYTVFGQIVEGLDVAIALVEGDRILSVR